MDNGGSEVLSYKVRFENQAGNMTSIEVDAEDMWKPQELLVSGLSEGELYTFYLQAVNAYGTSGASPALTVVAALPSGMMYGDVVGREAQCRPLGLLSRANSHETRCKPPLWVGG